LIPRTNVSILTAQSLVDQLWKAEVAQSRTDSGPKPEFVSFVCGGQDSEIPAQYLMTSVEAIEVIVECLRLGGAGLGVGIDVGTQRDGAF
jgi:hypothetical protein